MKKHGAGWRRACLFQGGFDTVCPAPGFASAEEQLQQVDGFPAFTAESTQAALAAADDGPVPGEFFQPSAAHDRAFFRVRCSQHMKIAAAIGPASGVLRLRTVAVADSQQVPGCFLLLRLIPGGTGIMPDETPRRRGQVLRPDMGSQHRPKSSPPARASTATGKKNAGNTANRPTYAIAAQLPQRWMTSCSCRGVTAGPAQMPNAASSISSTMGMTFFRNLIGPPL